VRLPRPRRASVLGVAFILVLVVVVFGLTAVMLYTPLVAVSLVAVVLVVYAGHAVGDELEVLVREWITRRTGPADDPRPVEADPVSFPADGVERVAYLRGDPIAARRAARLRHPSNWRNRAH
jgi:amino acid permease